MPGESDDAAKSDAVEVGMSHTVYCKVQAKPRHSGAETGCARMGTTTKRHLGATSFCSSMSPCPLKYLRFQTTWDAIVWRLGLTCEPWL